MARLMLLFLVVAPMILISCAGTGQKGYIFKVSKDIYERIKVDAKKKSETFNLRQASSGREVGDVIFDFKKNLTMIRLPDETSCFLRDSIGDVPHPADLLKLLQLARSSADAKLTTNSVEKLTVVGKLNDRSFLSSEMVDLCANLPIYRVTEGDPDQNQMDDPVPAKRGLGAVAVAVGKAVVKHYVCKEVCKGSKNCFSVPSGVSCSWRGCKTHYKTICFNVCKPVCGYVLG